MMHLAVKYFHWNLSLTYRVLFSVLSIFYLSSNGDNYRLLKIQSELEATLRNSETEQQVSPTKFEKPQFEYAFAAACKWKSQFFKI